MAHTNNLAKECIATALIELMKVKSYPDITITDIAKKSGMSRMTYYRNYTSKEDIIIQYIDDVADSIHQLILSTGVNSDVFTYYKMLFESLGVHSDIVLVGHKAHLGDLILDAINKNMLLTYPPSSPDPFKAYKRHYYAGAFYNILIEWLNGGKKETPEQLAQFICKIMETPRSKL